MKYILIAFLSLLFAAGLSAKEVKVKFKLSIGKSKETYAYRVGWGRRVGKVKGKIDSESLDFISKEGKKVAVKSIRNYYERQRGYIFTNSTRSTTEGIEMALTPDQIAKIIRLAADNRLLKSKKTTRRINALIQECLVEQACDVSSKIQNGQYYMHTEFYQRHGIVILGRKKRKSKKDEIIFLSKKKRKNGKADFLKFKIKFDQINL